ncbi:MAG: dihydrofolate reductase family protein [Cytophagaceae bacterium]|nr:dihydrofolate reductase family protein [Cytophagaceae bacterium]MBL0304163.1 dihydrofolate reductase family protein [Cytophagaceae bacterium]
MSRPKVILQVTASIDGRISLMPNTTMFSPIDESLKPFTISDKDWKYFDEKVKSLHKIDCYLEGSNMLVAENDKLRELPEFPGDTKNLYKDYLPESIVRREGRSTWTSVVDGRGRFRNGYKAYQDNPESYMLHLTSHSAPAEYLAFLQREEIPYLVSGKEKVDLVEAFNKLYKVLNVRCILTSSGGKFAGALIRENLLDEINILFNPAVYGGFQTPTLFNSPDINPPHILPNQLRYIESLVLESGCIWLRYEVIKN